MEYASKASHTHLINDPEIQTFLENCTFPKAADPKDVASELNVQLVPPKENPIRNVIAIDGGFSEVTARKDFPSATIAFFQFGALVFSVEDLDSLEEEPFIAPEQIAKLKQLERMKFSIPIKNVIADGCTSLTESVRKGLFDFFIRKMDDAECLAETLQWVIFEEYDSKKSTSWNLASCPACSAPNLELRSNKFKDFKTTCPSCKGTVFITDVFRFHERIDDEIGAGGILGYLLTTIEQVILAHLIRLVLSKKPSLLSEILFVKDGPLGFFGQAANMHAPFRSLVRYLIENHDLNLVGLEKSGAFVEHAMQVVQHLPSGSALLLTNEYIYKYIIPGKANPDEPYGRNTYFGNKVIFKTNIGSVYVATLPTKGVLVTPKEADFHNLHSILFNVEKLRCDMYDSALLPVALVNKLVSLSAHPSGRILERFVKQSME